MKGDGVQNTCHNVISSHSSDLTEQVELSP